MIRGGNIALLPAQVNRLLDSRRGAAVVAGGAAGATPNVAAANTPSVEEVAPTTNAAGPPDNNNATGNHPRAVPAEGTRSDDASAEISDLTPEHTGE